MSKLSGKVAMVTGCSGERGIGRAIARRLAADGADVVLTSSGVRLAINKPTGGWGGLEAVATEVRDAGQRALTVSVDVRSAVQIAEAMDRTLKEFGRLDILVNNAAAPAGADRVPVTQLSEDAWDIVLDVNLKGAFLCAKAAANVMLVAAAFGGASSTSGRTTARSGSRDSRPTAHRNLGWWGSRKPWRWNSRLPELP